MMGESAKIKWENAFNDRFHLWQMFRMETVVVLIPVESTSVMIVSLLLLLLLLLDVKKCHVL